MNAPAWVRCPSCGERARATKVKDAGSMTPVRLRTGAFLYECGTPAKDCGLRLGVFSIYVDEDGEVVYESKGNLDRVLDEFMRHARLVEDSIAAIRESPLSARKEASVLAMASEKMQAALSDVLREVP